MGVNSLPKTVTRQLRGCDLNPGPSAPESSTLTTRLASQLTSGRLTIGERGADLLDEAREEDVVEEILGAQLVDSLTSHVAR